MVLRNIFYAMEVDQHLIPVILRNVVNLEHALIKVILPPLPPLLIRLPPSFLKYHR